MRVSTTERQTYKRCRRKWDYASYNRQSLSPVINAPALDLGSLVHLVLAEWTAEPTLDPVALYSTRAQEYFQKLIALYTERVGCAPSQAELAPNMEAILLGKEMITNYQAHWKAPLPPGFTLVQNELSLIQPVPGTEHCVGDENGWCNCAECDCNFESSCTPDKGCDCTACKICHELECTFDGVMADEAGDLYIIERKTFSRTPSIDELNSNDQFLAYQWALTTSLRQAGSTQQVVGVAYDGLLKKPKPSGVHRLMSDLFLRRLLLRNTHELAEFGELLALELLEMADNPPIYKTVPPVQGCQRWECQYIDLCKATSKGEPTEDLLRMFVRTDRKSHLDLVTQEADDGA